MGKLTQCSFKLRSNHVFSCQALLRHMASASKANNQSNQQSPSPHCVATKHTTVPPAAGRLEPVSPHSVWASQGVCWAGAELWTVRGPWPRETGWCWGSPLSYGKINELSDSIGSDANVECSEDEPTRIPVRKTCMGKPHIPAVWIEWGVWLLLLFQ